MRSSASSTRARLDRLHEVVHGAQLERLHGRALVGRDEHERRGAGEAAQHARELDAVEARHADVEEHRVVGGGGERLQRLLAALGALDRVDVLVRAQHPREVVQRRALVVDGEDSHAARTPARNFGTSMRTAVPSPGVDSTCSP
jgi:hypothetical protein